MATLDQDADFDNITTALAALMMPSQTFSKPSADDTIADGANFAAMRVADAKFVDLFRSMRETDHDKIYAAATFWWTLGGDGFAPAAFCGRHLPDPFLFSSMLTGEFAEHRA